MMQPKGMLPQKPYLIRAFFNWIADSDLTPYIAVNALLRGVSVPKQYIKHGQIVFNISDVVSVEASSPTMTSKLG